LLYAMQQKFKAVYTQIVTCQIEVRSVSALRKGEPALAAGGRDLEGSSAFSLVGGSASDQLHLHLHF